MSDRLIEFTELVRLPGQREYKAGSRDHFPTEEAQRYIDRGWAKDPETDEQGERVPGSNGPVVPNNVSVPVG